MTPDTGVAIARRLLANAIDEDTPDHVLIGVRADELETLCSQIIGFNQLAAESTSKIVALAESLRSAHDLLANLDRGGGLGHEVHRLIRLTIGMRVCSACGRDTRAPGTICPGCCVDGKLVSP